VTGGWDHDEEPAEDCSDRGHYLCEQGRCIECGACEAECDHDDEEN